MKILGVFAAERAKMLYHFDLYGMPICMLWKRERTNEFIGAVSLFGDLKP